MRLEPSRLPGNQAVADRVALAERVLVELGQLRPHLRQRLGRDALVGAQPQELRQQRPRLRLGAVLGDAPAEAVGVGGGQAGQLLDHLQGVVLVDHEIFRVAEQFRQARVQRPPRLQAAPPADEARLHADGRRPRTHQRQGLHHVLECSGRIWMSRWRMAGDSSWETPSVSPRCTTARAAGIAIGRRRWDRGPTGASHSPPTASPHRRWPAPGCRAGRS